MSDLIKRSDAIEAVHCRVEIKDVIEAMAMQSAIAEITKNIANIPSADRPQGEWTYKNGHTKFCSECGFEEAEWHTVEYNFCPNCGARMKGADDE